MDRFNPPIIRKINPPSKLGKMIKLKIYLCTQQGKLYCVSKLIPSATVPLSVSVQL